jgi:hypothetical protein
VDHLDSITIHEDDGYYRDHDRGPGVDVHVAGVGIDIGR